MKYAFIKQHAGVHAVTRLCGVLGVSSSGYYDWRNRKVSQRSRENQALVGQIKTMKSHLKTMGCDLDDPLFTIHFLCMAGLPYIRILPNGIMDIVTQDILFPR